MGFPKGCKRPDHEALARFAPGHAHPHIHARIDAHASGASPLPDSADKLPNRPRGDQGRSGACTWGSSSIALYTSLLAFAAAGLGQALGFIPSQRIGYALTRALERADEMPPGVTVEPKLEDVGADLTDIPTIFGRYGVCPMICESTPDGRFFDLWTDADTGGSPVGNVNDEPDMAHVEEAGLKLIVGPHVIDPGQSDAIDLVCAALDATPPVAVEGCGLVGSAFETIKPGQVAQPTQPGETNQGGHAWWLSAYRTNPTTREREFKLENDWGDERIWGEPGYVRADGERMPGGFCWVSEAFVRKAWTLILMNAQIATPGVSDPVAPSSEKDTAPATPNAIAREAAIAPTAAETKPEMETAPPSSTPTVEVTKETAAPGPEDEDDAPRSDSGEVLEHPEKA